MKMKIARRNISQLLLLVTLLALQFGSAWAQNGTAVQTVEAASKAVVDQIGKGLDIQWTGLGQVAGEMVDATLTNNSSAPMTVNFIPGIVLTDVRGESQPIMLEEHVSFNLQPGEKVSLRNVRAYCLDHAKEPPALGQGVDYQVVTDLEEYEPAIRHLWAGLRLDKDGQFQPVLKPLQHRTLVIQRAIWSSLGGDNPDSKDKLSADLKADIRSAGQAIKEEKIDFLADQVWGDVTKTQDAAPQE